jgi:hypothetical protein
VYEQLPFGFDDLGEQRVKNIARPIRALTVRFVVHPVRQAKVLKLFEASAA